MEPVGCKVKIKPKAAALDFIACGVRAVATIDGAPVCEHHRNRVVRDLIIYNTVGEQVLNIQASLHREVRVKDLATGVESVPEVIIAGREPTWKRVTP